MFVWHKDESKKKSEGVWVRGIVVSQEGAMVLVEVHRAVLRVNQSKVRHDGDPWHDVAIPLKSDDSRGSEPSEVREDAPTGSSQDEAIERIGQKILDRASVKYCYEREICYHSLTAGKRVSLRSRFISRDSRLAPFIPVLRRVYLLSLANGIPGTFNLPLNPPGK